MAEDGKIVRLLFGQPDEELLKQVAESLSVPWYAENVHYYVAGESNAAFLLRAKHLEVVCSEPYANLNYGRGFTKPFLLERAIEDHGEILYLDFDCYELQPPDSRMWRILREGPTFQSLQLDYHAPRVLHNVDFHDERTRLKLLRTHCFAIRKTADIGGERARLGISPKLCFATCAVYCRDAQWISRWVRVYDEMAKQCLAFLDGNNEVALMYAMERQFGVEEAVQKLEEWDCPVADLGRTKAVEKLPEQVYFKHKKPKK